MKQAGIIFFLFIPLLVFVFSFLLDFNGLYGQDAFEYLRYSKALGSFFSGGPSPGNFYWPVLYPLLGAIGGFFTGIDFSLQFISIAAFCGTLYFTYRTIVILHGNNKNILPYILLFGLYSSYFLRLGVCIMSDMTAIFFLTASLFYIITFIQTRRWYYIIPAICFASAAVFTRYPSLVVLFLPLIILTYYLSLRFSSRLFPPAILTCLLVLIAIAAVKAKGFIGITGEWSSGNYFLNEYSTPGNGFLQYLFPNLLFAASVFFHPGYLLVSGLLLFFIKKQDLQGKIFMLILLPILIYLFFLAGFRHQSVRLNTLIFPFILISYYPAFNRFNSKILNTSVLNILFFSSMAAVQSILFYFAFDDFYAQNHLEKKVASFIDQNYTGVPVYTFGMTGALQTYSKAEIILSLADSSVKNCSSRKIILLQEENLNTQWKFELPSGNWSYLVKNCRLKKIISFERGWNLYEAE